MRSVKENIIAIVVPFLVSYGATAMGVAAATATTIATITSVAFQVTGINNKINKAASKVFGEDLVMIANVAGAVYGAVNGGFGGGGADAAAAATDASSAMAVNGMDAASDAFSAAGGLASDGFSALSSTSDASSLMATNGLDMADNTFNLANKAAGGGLASDGVGVAATTSAPTATQGVDLMKGTQVTGTDTKALAEATKTADATNASSTAAAAPAAAAPATAPAAPSASGSNAAGLKAAAATKPGSFFGKLLSNDKAVGALIQGVGGGLQSASNNKAKQEELEFQKKLRNSVPTLYVKGAQA